MTGKPIVARLDRADPGLIAFEPTGGYERTLAAVARGRGVPFVRLHPDQVIAFRRSRAPRGGAQRRP